MYDDDDFYSLVFGALPTSTGKKLTATPVFPNTVISRVLIVGLNYFITDATTQVRRTLEFTIQCT